VSNIYGLANLENTWHFRKWDWQACWQHLCWCKNTRGK